MSNPDKQQWQRLLHRQFADAKLNEPMSRHTTFRIGGPADAYVEVKDDAALAALYRFAREQGIRIFIIGWGSNLLVKDGGIRGIVARLRGRFESLEFDGPRVLAGAGARLPALAAQCAAHGLSGAEPLAGVPGTVGGALVMNAGTREREIGDLVHAVRVFDARGLEGRWLAKQDIEFGYRASSLDGRVILGAELRLKRGSKVDILKRVRSLQKKRQATQPIHTYNVGSTFKNPPGHFVAQLIEAAGLKGLRCGGAKVSAKHANFVENDRHAAAQDVLDLVETVRSKVRERCGLDLELEMKVVGEA